MADQKTVNPKSEHQQNVPPYQFMNVGTKEAPEYINLSFVRQVVFRDQIQEKPDEETESSEESLKTSEKELVGEDTEDPFEAAEEDPIKVAILYFAHDAISLPEPATSPILSKIDGTKEWFRHEEEGEISYINIGLVESVLFTKNNDYRLFWTGAETDPALARLGIDFLLIREEEVDRFQKHMNKLLKPPGKK